MSTCLMYLYYTQGAGERRTSDLLYGAQSKLGERLLLPARQGMTSRTRRTIGGKYHCRVEIEKATIDEGNGKLSNELAGNLNPG